MIITISSRNLSDASVGEVAVRVTGRRRRRHITHVNGDTSIMAVRH